jgi:hypothetical protein
MLLGIPGEVFILCDTSRGQREELNEALQIDRGEADMGQHYHTQWITIHGSGQI